MKPARDRAYTAGTPTAAASGSSPPLRVRQERYLSDEPDVAALPGGAPPDIVLQSRSRGSRPAASENRAEAAVRTLAPLQRGDGVAALRIAARHGISRLVHLHQVFPCRLLFPNAAAGEPPLAVWTTLSGGLVGGDRLRLEIVVEPGASLSVTSQAAERAYRSNGADCVVDASISIAEDAWLDWMPRPTILFDGARLRRRTTISVAPGGRLLACDGFTFGRIARGETFASGILFDHWRINWDARPIWVDTLRLDDPGKVLAAPAAFAGSRAMAMALYVAVDAAQHLDVARAILAASEERAGVTVINDVLVARFLGRAPDAVQRDLIRYLAALRPLVSPYSATLPRIGND